MKAGIQIRKARDSDRDAMLEITRDVWEGTDYVPFHWDAWLADSNGCLMVAVKEDRPVGFQHLHVQPDECCWLEGIRVASDQRGQGVAHQLFDHGVSWARENGCPNVRLTTSGGNPASRRVAEKGGLRIVERFQPLIATPSLECEQPATVRLADPTEARTVGRHLEASGSTFYTEGWTAFRLTKERVQLLLAVSSVLIATRQRDDFEPSVGQEDHIEGIAIATCFNTFASLRVGLLTGSLDARKDLLHYLRRAAVESGVAEVRATLALDEIGLLACTQSGFEKSYDFSAELWELTL